MRCGQPGQEPRRRPRRAGGRDRSVNARRNDPSVEGAYGRSKSRPIAAVPQQRHVVDLVRAGDHPGHQRGHLPARRSRPCPSAPQLLVGQLVQPGGLRPAASPAPAPPPTPDSARRTSLPPPAGYEIVASTRCPSCAAERDLRQVRFCCHARAFSRSAAPTTHIIGGSRLSLPLSVPARNACGRQASVGEAAGSRQGMGHVADQRVGTTSGRYARRVRAAITAGRGRPRGGATRRRPPRALQNDDRVLRLHRDQLLAEATNAPKAFDDGERQRASGLSARAFGRDQRRKSSENGRW